LTRSFDPVMRRSGVIARVIVMKAMVQVPVWSVM